MVWNIFIFFFLLLNTTVFIVFGVDKYLARKRYRRISEKRLLQLALAGGSIGAIIAQRFFRHKTLKFRYILWMFLGVHLAVMMAVVLVNGSFPESQSVFR